MSNDIIRVFAGYDPNEAAGYHAFCHSVITRSSRPVSITPIASNQFSWWKRTNPNDKPGATEFSFARFLIPYLCGYRGHAIFVDGADMICLGDIAELWDMRKHRYAVQCVKHGEYAPTPIKMWNQENRWYPRKNWSSVMILNCDYHHAWQLTPEAVASESGEWLHRFGWTEDSRIGELPPEWNCLVGHHDSKTAKILHYTNGLPDVHVTTDLHAQQVWYTERKAMNHITPHG